jgi:hypothetical protein
MPLPHNNDYRIADPNNRVKQMNGQNIVNPSRTTAGTTNVDGGAAIGMNSTANLTNVGLARNYTDDNSNSVGGDISPIVFVNLGETGEAQVIESTNPSYVGFAAFNTDGMNLAVGDAIKFSDATNYSGVYRVLANVSDHCVFNTSYVTSGNNEFSLVYKQSGTIDTQSAAYTAVGRKGNEMERDRVHQVQKLVMDNAPALLRSGYYNFQTNEFTRDFTFTDRYPSFQISGTRDETVINHGLSVGGGYAIKLGKGVRNMKRGRHDGKNES